MSPVLSSADLRVGAAPVLSVNRGSAPIWTPGGPGGLPEIGDSFEGGFFAGLISHTADGNPTHALIVAPQATGASGTGYAIETNLRWKTSNSATAGTGSDFDGLANTEAMSNTSHPAANFCANLTIAGFSDWYLPARFELDIAYQGLKPTTTNNSTSFGVNPYSVPERTSDRTTSEPGQTVAAAFQVGGEEAFVSDTQHVSSTERDASNVWGLTFDTGNQTSGGITARKTFENKRVRGFRRVAL